MPPLRDPNRLERHIYFYRSRLTSAGQNADAAAAFDPTRYFECLEQVATSDDRYLELGERVTSCVVDRRGTLPRIRLVNIRRSDLPEVETDGVFTPLNIGERSGLAERIHLVFFPNHVVGSEFNFYGPRVGRLAEFLQRKCGAPIHTFDGLIRPDVIAELDRFGELSMVNLRMRRDSIDTVRHLDESLWEALNSTENWSGAADVELVLRKRPHSREMLPERLLLAVRRLAGSDDVRHAAKSFRLSGRIRETGAIGVVDVLSSDLVSTKRILRAGPRLRSLDSADAYASIEDAYQELRAEIGAAGTVGLA